MENKIVDRFIELSKNCNKYIPKLNCNCKQSFNYGFVQFDLSLGGKEIHFIMNVIDNDFEFMAQKLEYQFKHSLFELIESVMGVKK